MLADVQVDIYLISQTTFIATRFKESNICMLLNRLWCNTQYTYSYIYKIITILLFLVILLILTKFTSIAALNFEVGLYFFLLEFLDCVSFYLPCVTFLLS